MICEVLFTHYNNYGNMTSVVVNLVF